MALALNSGAGNVTPACLQQVVLPLVTVSQCQQYWGSHITNSMICASASRAFLCQVSTSTPSCTLHLVAPCTPHADFALLPLRNDSRGPLISQNGNGWVLTSIVSRGTSDCNVCAPATYTRVSKFSTWVNQA
ncbi:Chymotrypsin-like protease CTRL-1 [Camelus dromedarius]|uniref:Chymotrypsin-like protease CTRL-1 n=1 Tax=Camelus dromedarius TaxID=9838 RepID=A0A5N4DSR4_CAMDR|nr:Chymotrypsin-like protease CTRL-1 [Camelus dromedarius]